MRETRNERLLINRLPRGGYAVLTVVGGGINEALAAFTDIDDALGFIKDELGVPETEKPSIVTTDVTSEVNEKFPPLPGRGIYRGIV